MGYEITVTKEFLSGIKTLPNEYLSKIQQQIDNLRSNPFSQNHQSKPLKTKRNTFRIRIGKIRLLYQVIQKQQRVIIFALRHRKNAYSKIFKGQKEVDIGDINSFIEEQKTNKFIAENYPTRSQLEDFHYLDDTKIEIEQLDWITDDELFQLKIPDEYWNSILEIDSDEQLEILNIPETYKNQIEDYLTTPDNVQTEKLYSLGEDEDLDSFSKKSLSQFLIALDPEQKKALNKLKSSGPYLIKGSAGTGKTLVGLYHIVDLIKSRKNESLFDVKPIKIGVITYTNTLSVTNKSILDSIKLNNTNVEIKFSTLDKIAYELSTLSLGNKINILNIDGLSSKINEKVIPQLNQNQHLFCEKIGTKYVAEEIEKVIFGKNISSFERYSKENRQGRKRGLKQDEREIIWDIYLKLKQWLSAQKISTSTFEEIKCTAFNNLTNLDHYSKQEHQFSSLFVDEAQDLSNIAKKLCLELTANPEELILAADTGQSIYTTSSPWAQIDSRFNFKKRRPITLTKSYRASKEISKAIQPLRNDPGDEFDKSDIAISNLSGKKPKWYSAPLKDHMEVAYSIISELINSKKNSINLNQIALIIRDNKKAEIYKSFLDSKNIGASIVSKTSPIDITGTKLHIITAHSSKGLGFPIVITPELHQDIYPSSILLRDAKDDDQRSQILDSEQRLLYVALTRAMYDLYIIVDIENPSPFTDLLDIELWERSTND